MTPNQKLLAIEEKISDKELKMGAEGTICEEKSDGVFTDTKFIVLTGEDSNGCFTANYGYIGMEEDFTILGTPPDLCRVLWWLQKYHGDNIKIEKMYHSKDRGQFLLVILLWEKGKFTPFYWDLSIPLLRDQKEELWELLYNTIFKVKEMEDSLSCSL